MTHPEPHNKALPEPAFDVNSCQLQAHFTNNKYGCH